MYNKHKNKTSGFGSIEILVASSIIAIAFLGLKSTATMSLKILNLSTHRLKASFLLEEGMEALKIMRDNGWVNVGELNPYISYYFVFEDSTWKTTSVNTFIDGVYERTITIPNRIKREDGTDDIVPPGPGTYTGLGTRGFNYTVSWSDGKSTSTESVYGYIMNIFE